MNIDRFILFTVFISGAAGLTFAQDVKPTPPREEGEVVKIATNLIKVDVTVTNAKGEPITDLRRDEIEIYENGRKQTVTSLTFVSAGEATVSRAKVKNAPGEADPPEPPRSLKPENVGRVIALVVDDLSLSFESAYYTRRALRKFVDEQMQPGDLVAIVRVGAGMGALQQFTTDKRLLHAAIDRAKWNPLGRGGTSAFAAIEPTPLEMQAAAGGEEIDEEDLKAEKEFLDGVKDFREAVYVTGTLGALRFLVGGMSELSGRKSVILFTNGIPMQQRIEHGFTSHDRTLDFMSELIDAANRASVVFYAIDSRGLQPLGITAADKIAATPGAYSRALSERSREMWNSHEGMDYLTKETGGFAVVNNNDLAGGVRRVLRDQSYYLLTYEPEAETFDPKKRKFNKLDVKVSRSGATVRTRSGFINQVTPREPLAVRSGRTPQQQIDDALSSPFGESDISLALNPLYGYHPRQGNFIKSLLHVDAADLQFQDEPDGRKKAEIVIVGATFGDNGQLVQSLSRGYTLLIQPQKMEKLLRDGFVYQLTFPIRSPGMFQFRVAIRDQQSGKLGSANQLIEIPDLKKGRPYVSSLVLQGYSSDEWLKVSNSPGSGTILASDPNTDTSKRQFRVGSVVEYGFEIYNLRPPKDRETTSRIRVFRDGKLVMNGSPGPVTAVSGDQTRLAAGGAIKLNETMLPGDYVLQVIVSDGTKKKKRLATQFVQFEVTR